MHAGEGAPQPLAAAAVLAERPTTHKIGRQSKQTDSRRAEEVQAGRNKTHTCRTERCRVVWISMLGACMPTAPREKGPHELCQQVLGADRYTGLWNLPQSMDAAAEAWDMHQCKSGWLMAVLSRFQRRPVGLTFLGACKSGESRHGIGERLKRAGCARAAHVFKNVTPGQLKYFSDIFCAISAVYAIPQKSGTAVKPSFTEFVLAFASGHPHAAKPQHSSPPKPT